MAAGGVAHGRRVDARRHVVARQTGGPGPGAVIGAHLEQHLHRFGVTLLDGPHQRGRAAQVLLRVDVRAGGHEHPDRPRIAVARRQHQHRLAVGEALLRVGAGLEKPFDHRHVAVQRRHRERRERFAVGRVDLRAGGDEQAGGLEVVAIDGPVERRRAVDLRCVDVGVLLQQPAQRGLVAFHRRVGHLALVRRAARR